MRLALSTVCFIALLVHTSVAEETPSWAWGKEKTGDNPNQDVVPTSTGFSFHDQDLNETNVDGLIDSIISSTRQGRTLQGFDEVYSDPNLQEAIQKGDGQARNLIKDKLCSLGLMECDGVSARRPHHPLSPEDLIYAQPVAIKPIGHPIPSIPVRGPPRGGYGPPKPVPPPHGPSGIYGPPRPIGHGPPRRGYGPPFKPSGSYYESHGSSSSFSSKPLGPIFEPIEPEGPYPFEVPSKIHNKEKLPIEVVVNAQGGSSQSTTANGGVQQHVHHHFHHGEGANVKVPTVVVNNPVPIATQGHIHASSSAGIVGGTIVDSGFAPINSFGGGYKDTSFSTHKDITTATFANANNGLGTYASGVKPIIENYSPQSFGSSGTLSSNSFGSSGTFGSNSFGSSDAFGSNSFGSSGIHGANSYGNSGTLGSFSTLGTNSFGASVGSYGSSSSPFYKKELNLNRPLNGNSLQSTYGQSSYADSYRGFESIRNENYDCVCVPYDQCPTQDIIGRKDDLYLPLDPRNLKSDIEAITDEVVVTDENGTMSVIRVPKQIKLDKPVENAESKSAEEAKKVSKREAPLDKSDAKGKSKIEPRQAYIASGFGNVNNCGPRHVCCRRPTRPQIPIPGNGRQCGTKHSQGINGRVKNPSYIDGDSEFGEYPWQVAILKKDPKESVYVCGGTLIDSNHILTAAHCVKTYSGFDLRVRLGEWDVNHDVEFFPYIERDIQSVHVHPEFYAGTLYNDLAILRMNKAVDWTRSPHISPACLPDAYTDYTGARCWTTGWGKDAFGQYGKYQNILKEVDVPIISHAQCQAQMKQTRLGYDFKLHNGFICAGGEEGKDACKGDGGGPMVCERGGSWKVVGVVSWGIGCGQAGVPGVYVKVAHYLDWIKQIVNTY